MISHIDVPALIRRMLLAGLPLVQGCVPICDEPGVDPDCVQTWRLEEIDLLDPRLGPLVRDCERGYRCGELCGSFPHQYEQVILACEVLADDSPYLVDAGATADAGADNDAAVAADASGEGAEAGGRRFVRIIYQQCPICGRRPEGWEPGGDAMGDGLGGWLAVCAELEAASVRAFRTLAAELRHHGAPAGLVEAARVAATEEVRHARLTRALARRRGAPQGSGSMRAGAAPVRRVRAGVRSLAAVAVENAVEGCVRETFGAAVAAWQARAGGDPEVRALMAAIAPDEAGHAALSFRVHAWARSRLSPGERRRVDGAARAALGELAGTDWEALPVGLRERAGLPGGVVARGFVGELARVWEG
jgi:hypothetical protein